MNRNRASWFSCLLFTGLIPVALCGCTGTEGPSRYELSGTVTYNGQPVPAGEVVLEPDSSQGNEGPGCLAMIENGRYQTEPGTGIVGGPYRVRIMGFDGVPVGDSAQGTAIFPLYQTQVEFPKQSTTHDFNILAATGGSL